MSGRSLRMPASVSGRYSGNRRKGIGMIFTTDRTGRHAFPVYLDNAATSFPKPPSVIRAVEACPGTLRWQSRQRLAQTCAARRRGGICLPCRGGGYVWADAIRHVLFSRKIQPPHSILPSRAFCAAASGLSARTWNTTLSFVPCSGWQVREKLPLTDFRPFLLSRSGQTRCSCHHWSMPFPVQRGSSCARMPPTSAPQRFRLPPSAGCAMRTVRCLR